ncbi:MAG: hypothetical protein JWO07_787 [Candidatus Saccharibacteria bacterium]|nr:hypothetical protein [Candidatus Saccharibacteria bacterium]
MEVPREIIPAERDGNFDKVINAEKALENLATSGVDYRIFRTTGNLLYFSDAISVRNDALVQFAHDPTPQNEAPLFIEPGGIFAELLQLLDIDEVVDADEEFFALLGALDNRELEIVKKICENHQEVILAFREALEQFFDDNKHAQRHIDDRAAFVRDLLIIAEEHDEEITQRIPLFESDAEKYHYDELYHNLRKTYESNEGSEVDLQKTYTERFSDTYDLQPALLAAIRHRLNLSD